VLDVLAGWAASAGFFLASDWKASEAQEIWRGRTCTPGEYFTRAECRVALDGRVVKLTHNEVRLQVAGRELTMPVQIVGDVSDRDGTAVVVTLWRGRPIRVEGPALRAQAIDAPTKKNADYRIGGWFFLIAPPALAAANLLFSWVFDRYST
jgi:hypothetical protein